MKAIQVHQFGGPEVLTLADVADPQAGPGELVIKLEAIGVNPVDTYIRAGIHAMQPAFPYVPGSDAAGCVETVGEGVTAFKPGDRVYAAGSVRGSWNDCYAERLLRRADQVFALPEEVSFAQGSALGVPYGTAYRALFQRAGARAGESVFVHGASGAVGTAAVQLAASHGMTAIGTAGSERGRELVKAQGAAHVLDHTAAGYLDSLAELCGGKGPDVILEMLADVNLANDMDGSERGCDLVKAQGAHVLDHTAEGYLDSVAELCGGKGPDVILEMLADVNLANDMEVAGHGGRIVVIGNRGAIEINARVAMMKDLDIRGMALPNTPDEPMAEIHAALGKGLAAGDLKPVIGLEMALAEAAAAHVKVLEPGAYGKIVLLP